METIHEKLQKLLEETFNSEGDILILAVAITPLENSPLALGSISSAYQVRIALTYMDNEGVVPYFDGSDLYVSITVNDIEFILEDEWTDGPPLVEGSPIKLVLSWVSELAEPFYISPEALAATQPSPHFVDGNDDIDDDHNQEKEGSGN